MSLKRKLFTAVSMFALTCAMLLVGVWAVSSTSIEIGGTISFSATNVNATVSGSITGSSAGTITPTTLEYSSSKTPTTEALNTWKNNLSFDEAGTDIVLSITVKNESTERALYVNITDTVGAVTNITKTPSFTLGEDNKLETGESKTFTITFDVSSTDVSADGSYGYSLTLTDSSQKIELKHDTENGDYYVEMGTYNSAPVRWKVVGVKNEETSEVEHYVYNENQAPTGELTFIQETVLDVYEYGYVDDSEDCFDENDEWIGNANSANSDYSQSYLREYITGTDCSDKDITKTYLEKLEISDNDVVYKNIQARSISDLYEDMIFDVDWSKTDCEIIDGVLPEGSTGFDKLWIPSIKDIYTLVGGGTTVIAGETETIPTEWSSDIVEKIEWNEWPYDYWLRSPNPHSNFMSFRIALNNGFMHDTITWGSGVRPMFVLEI